MDRPKLEVADVFRRYGEAYRQQAWRVDVHGAAARHDRDRGVPHGGPRRPSRAVRSVRPSSAFAYNSLPRIGTAQSASRWPAPNGSKTARPNFSTAEYFHVVFTVPEEIAAIAYQNKKVVYGILFRATAETLTHHRRRSQTSGRRDRLLRRAPQLGVRTCCIIPICIASSPAAASRPMARAGSPAGPDSSCPCACSPVCSAACFWNICRTPSMPANCSSSPPWNSCASAARSSATWLLYARAEWVVYAKRPFAGPEQVLDYVGRYTHRVAISNNRLLDIDNGQVTLPAGRTIATTASRKR